MKRSANGCNVGEQIVEQALCCLIGKGQVLHFIHSRASDQYDAEGLDFLVYLKGGLALPIQVKADCGSCSCTDNERRKKVTRKHLRKHPYVRCVVFVNPVMENEIRRVERQISGKIGYFLKTTFTEQRSGNGHGAFETDQAEGVQAIVPANNVLRETVPV